MFVSLTKTLLQRSNQTIKPSTFWRYLNVHLGTCTVNPVLYRLPVPVKHFHTTPLYHSCDAEETDPSTLGKVGVKMRILFTCKKCNTRNDKFMSKQAYEKGIVLVRCDGCQNLHLIADNLNWFQNPHGKNVEEILASKGEVVQKISDIYEFNNLDLEVSRKCLVVGASTSLQKTITEEDVRVFSALTGDWNPIHHQKDNSVVHGALLNGLVSGVIGTKLPGPGTILVKEFLRFPNPCYVGDTVTVTVTLTDIGKMCTCTFQVVSEKYSNVVMEGEAKLLIKNG